MPRSRQSIWGWYSTKIFVSHWGRKMRPLAWFPTSVPLRRRTRSIKYSEFVQEVGCFGGHLYRDLNLVSSTSSQHLYCSLPGTDPIALHRYGSDGSCQPHYTAVFESLENKLGTSTYLWLIWCDTCLSLHATAKRELGSIMTLGRVSLRVRHGGRMGYAAGARNPELIKSFSLS